MVIWNLECPIGLSQKEICAHFNEGNWAQSGQSDKRGKRELCNVLELVARK